MKRVTISGGFDDLRLSDFRFIDEAAKLGPLRISLWSDTVFESVVGHAPKFPQAEREYLLRSIRHVSELTIHPSMKSPEDLLPKFDQPADELWAIREIADRPANREWARAQGIECRIITDTQLQQLASPPPVPENPRSARKKVVVTGCFDWFHSGHVRFFEECSELGDLYVIVGHDENIRMLKGAGHPLFPATARRYIAGSVRYVKEALISSGSGWMDGEPEFKKLRADIYAVNEDGDKSEKKEFCKRFGLEYKVLKRLPKSGLPRRESTKLRGF